VERRRRPRQGAGDPVAGGAGGYFEELAPILRHEGGAGPPEYYALAERYGITIQNDWIEELERTYGVKL
jgi:hypothetical protein